MCSKGGLKEKKNHSPVNRGEMQRRNTPTWIVCLRPTPLQFFHSKSWYAYGRGKNSLHVGCKESFLHPLTYTSCWSIKIEKNKLLKCYFVNFDLFFWSFKWWM